MEVFIGYDPFKIFHELLEVDLKEKDARSKNNGNVSRNEKDHRLLHDKQGQEAFTKGLDFYKLCSFL